MEKYQIPILGISEVKRKGNGVLAMDKDYTLRYSGVNKDRRAKEGVGVILNRYISDKVLFWEPINSRIIRVDIDLEETVSLIQIYAPTDDSNILDKDMFYCELQKTLDKARQEVKHVMIIGDWNSRVGDDVTTAFGTMGRYGAENV